MDTGTRAVGEGAFVTSDPMLELVLEHDELADLDPAARRLALRSLATEVLDPADVPAAVAEVADLIDGFGPLTHVMREPGITDILVNGPNEIWIDGGDGLTRAALSFRDRE